jgi:hypothetical protein
VAGSPSIRTSRGRRSASARPRLLAAWIEKGRAPETIVATRYGEDGSIVAQCPWCAHPMVAVWEGVGARNAAKSYTCQSRR